MCWPADQLSGHTELNNVAVKTMDDLQSMRVAL